MSHTAAPRPPPASASGSRAASATVPAAVSHPAVPGPQWWPCRINQSVCCCVAHRCCRSQLPTTVVIPPQSLLLAYCCSRSQIPTAGVSCCVSHSALVSNAESRAQLAAGRPTEDPVHGPAGGPSPPLTPHPSSWPPPPSSFPSCPWGSTPHPAGGSPRQCSFMTRYTSHLHVTTQPRAVPASEPPVVGWAPSGRTSWGWWGGGVGVNHSPRQP